MNELQFQRLTCKAVQSAGGFATKLSHRFLVGIPDLLIKLPHTAAMLVEVKTDKRPVKNLYLLDITPRQAQVLRSADSAGMMAGVVSFLQDKSQLGVRVIPISVFDNAVRIQLWATDYQWFVKKNDKVIISNLADLIYAPTAFTLRNIKIIREKENV